MGGGGGGGVVAQPTRVIKARQAKPTMKNFMFILYSYANALKNIQERMMVRTEFGKGVTPKV